MSASRARPVIDSDELPPDTRLLGGRLVVDVRIGSGGASTVYAATTDDGRDVALKIMSADQAELPTSRLRFENEVALAQHLVDHPHVVTPYEMGVLPELDGRPYITMPLVPGRSLLLLLGQLPMLDALALLRDLALVVADVHDRGIVHRDIKPGNVIVREHEGTLIPHLIDFGLAHGTGDGSAPMSARLTAAHELPGTKHYMAPEQILGAPPDPRFDVYALGVSMVEVLTGILPLHDLSPADAARRKCDAGQPSLSIADRVPGLPQRAVDAIDAALEREPGARTSSARQLAERLSAVVATMRAAKSGRDAVRSAPHSTVARPEGGDPEVEESLVVDARNRAIEFEFPTEQDRPTTLAAGARTEVERRASIGSRRWLVLAFAIAAALLLIAGIGVLLPQRSGTAEASAPPKVDSDRVMAGISASGDALLDDDSTGGRAGAADTIGEEHGGAMLADVAPNVEPDVEPDAGSASPDDSARVIEPAPERPRKRRPSPKRPAPTPEECAKRVADAQAASRDRRWRSVLQLTKSSECWSDPDARTWLRVEALSELGRFEQCAALGRTSRNPEIARMVKSCDTQLRKETSP